MADAAAQRILKILCCVISHFPPKLKAEWKGKLLNYLYELRLESTNIIYSYPLERFDEVYIVSGSIAGALCHKVRTLRKTFDAWHIVVQVNYQLHVNDSLVCIFE